MEHIVYFILNSTMAVVIRGLRNLGSNEMALRLSSPFAGRGRIGKAEAHQSANTGEIPATEIGECRSSGEDGSH